MSLSEFDLQLNRELADITAERNQWRCHAETLFREVSTRLELAGKELPPLTTLRELVMDSPDLCRDVRIAALPKHHLYWYMDYIPVMDNEEQTAAALAIRRATISNKGLPIMPPKRLHSWQSDSIELEFRITRNASLVGCRLQYRRIHDSHEEVLSLWKHLNGSERVLSRLLDYSTEYLVCYSNPELWKQLKGN